MFGGDGDESALGCDFSDRMPGRGWRSGPVPRGADAALHQSRCRPSLQHHGRRFDALVSRIDKSNRMVRIVFLFCISFLCGGFQNTPRKP